jgi:tetratricopeptide (TPR) repeat protein
VTNRKSTLRRQRAAPAPAVPAVTTKSGSDLDPEERDQRLYRAVLAYQAGQYVEAEADARGLLDEAPRFFPAMLLLGMVAGRTARPSEGIELLRQAVALDRRSIEAHNELASLLRAEGRNDEAIAEAKHAVRLFQADPGSHNNLGLCYLAAGRVPLAITHFKRAIDLRPGAAMFQHNLGLALEQQSRDFEAIAAFRRALGLDQDIAEAWAHLGRLLFQHGQPEEASRCYERAATLHPDPTIAAFNQAEALIQQGNAPEAEECLRRAILAEPRSDVAYQVLGVLLQRCGRFDEAIECLERAIELQPKRISAYSSLLLGKKIGRDDDRLIERMSALVADPALAARDRSRLHFALGKAFDDLGDCETAIGHFDRAHEIEAEEMRRAGRPFDRRGHKAGVDWTIGGFTADFFARHGAEGSDSNLPVLIVGMPRSGTTLVEQILSSHPDVGAAGELSFWTDRRAFAGAVLSGAVRSGQLRQAADDYLALLRAVSLASRRITDKMPANFMMLGLIHLTLPNARIVHLRRDPIDTCLSIWSTPFGNPLDFVHERTDLVFYYEQYVRLMAHWRAVIPPDRLFEIDYEALVAEPERLTREIVGFCGLGWDDACLRHEGNKHLIMTPSIWQARQPVYRAAVGRGQRYEKWLSDFHRLLDHRKPVTEAANQTRTGRGQAGAQEKTPADRTDAAKEGS